MSNLIERQKAIDALERGKDKSAKGDIGGFYNRIIQKDIDTIKQLPSAEPQERRGKWIYGEDTVADCVDGYRCNQCGFFVPWDYQHKFIDFIKDYHFCPNCGVRMEVDNA